MAYLGVGYSYEAWKAFAEMTLLCDTTQSGFARGSAVAQSAAWIDSSRLLLCGSVAAAR